MKQQKKTKKFNKKVTGNLNRKGNGKIQITQILKKISFTLRKYEIIPIESRIIN